jgi:hypothetical protein
MNYESLYKDFSPLKFKINNDYIDKIQQNQPLIMAFDNNAYNNMASLLSNNVENFNHKYNEIYKKTYLINDIQTNTIKIFLGLFIILYLVAPKFELLRVEDDLNKKIYKPNMFRIILISFIISLFYFGYQGIDLLSDFHQILFA